MGRAVNFHDDYRKLSDCYPPEIRRFLDDLFTRVIDVLGVDALRGVLLVGSAARNELSYSYDQGTMDLHSDVEYVAVTHRPVSAETLGRLSRLNQRLAAELGVKSPLFAIDCGIATARRWKLRPKTLFSFEARELGVVVYGEDLRRGIPAIALESIDHGSVNTLILVRLWNMLLHMPRSYLFGEPTPYEEFVVRFFYARNILDLLTIYLPTRGVLQAGYRQRLRAFHELPGCLFEDEEIRIIDAAHHLKLEMVDGVTTEEAGAVFFSGYLKLLAHVADVPRWDGSPETLAAFMESVARRDPFREQLATRAGRIVRELRMFPGVVLRRPNLRNLLWIAKDKRYPVLTALISLHAMLSGDGDEMQREAFLSHAARAIETATGEPVDVEGMDLIEAVDQLRRVLMRFMPLWRNASTRPTHGDVPDSMNSRNSPNSTVPENPEWVETQ